MCLEEKGDNQEQVKGFYLSLYIIEETAKPPATKRKTIITGSRST